MPTIQMPKRRRHLFARIIGRTCVGVAMCVAVAACGDDASSEPGSGTPGPTPTAAPAAAIILGKWSGLWTSSGNYGEWGQGPIEVVITQRGDALHATGSIGWDIDLIGHLIGQATLWTGSATGQIEGDAVHFSFESAIGTGAGEVVGTTISGSGRVTAPLLPAHYRRGKGFTFTGQLVGDRAYGTFVIANVHVGSAELFREYPAE
jgi:hypothetical protein